MKKINQYKLLAGICVLSLFTACDFEELNTNPFEMTDEMGIRDGVAVGGAVTAMQRAVVTVGTQADDTEAINQYQVAYNLSADSWSGFFGQNNNWYSGSNNTTYYLQDNWVAATYTNSYTTLLSSWKKIKQESEKTETPEIFALAQILNKDYAAAKSTLNGVANKDAYTSYLLAIVAARTNDAAGVNTNLKDAVSKDSSLKSRAVKDLEFAEYKSAVESL